MVPVAGLNVLPPKPVAKANLTSETVSPAKVISSDDRAGRTRLVMSERWPDRAGPELEKTPLEIPHIARQRQADRADARPAGKDTPRNPAHRPAAAGADRAGAR